MQAIQNGPDGPDDAAHANAQPENPSSGTERSPGLVHLGERGLYEGSDFETLFTQYICVDKTAAIAEFFLYGRGNVDLLLRPRGAGKSTMLSMLKYFLELDEPTKETRRAVLENGHAAIMGEPHRRIVQEHFAQYPVLYLDFSHLVPTVQTWDATLTAFAYNLNNEVARLKKMGYLEDEMCASDRDDLQRLADGGLHNLAELSDLPLRLTEMVERATGKKVIVLIDGYDRLLYSVRTELYDKMENFLASLYLILLKGNSSLHGAFMVGILRMFQPGILSSLNNIEEYPLHATFERYARACMFTEAETYAIFCHYKSNNTINFDWDDMKSWYNGYSCAIPGERLWNPWSVVQALCRNSVGPHWSETGSADVLDRIASRFPDSSKSVVAWLATGQSSTRHYQSNIPYKLLSDEGSQISQLLAYEADEILLGFLLCAGYLTAEPQESASYECARTMRVPNKEIQSIFYGWIRNDTERHFSEDGAKTKAALLLEPLFSGQSQPFRVALQNAIADVPHCAFGPADVINSIILHALLRCAFSLQRELSRHWELRDRPGVKFVIMWQEHGKGERGIVIALKSTLTAADMRVDAAARLRHTKGDHGVGNFPSHITEGWLFGISFYKSSCFVVAEAYKK